MPSIAAPAAESAIALPQAVSDVEAGAAEGVFNPELERYERPSGQAVARDTTGRPRSISLPRGVLPLVGGFLGPIGRLIGTILDFFVSAANRAAAPAATAGAAAGGAAGALRTAGTADRSGQPDLSRLTEAQVRDLARASGMGNMAAAGTLDLWREQQRQASAQRLATIDRLLAEIAQPGPAADTGAPPGGGAGTEEIALPEGLPPEEPEEESFTPGDGGYEAV